MRERIPGNRDRRGPLSLNGRDTIQGAGLLRGGREVSHEEILPSFRRGESLVTMDNFSGIQETQVRYYPHVSTKSQK